MDPTTLASQKRREMLPAFWPRKVSPYLTRVLVRTPLTPNQTTILWGAISVANSYTVYLALTGSWVAIALVPVIYQFAFVLDCVDGEIARLKNMANPVGGKLLDGICHRATEFALLATFAMAASAKSGSWLVLPVALLLISSDAMYVFAYERRLSALRFHAGFKGQIRNTPAGRYQRGMQWNDLTGKQQLLTITGLFHYKSVYAVIALSHLPPDVFLAGLAGVALYKHSKWILLVRRTLQQVVALTTASPEPPAQPAEANGAAAERLTH